jgi:hypothetical protein
MILNKAISLIYSPGHGGEFLAWLVGQNPAFAPVQSRINNNNKWDLQNVPKFFHTAPVPLDQTGINFSTDLINIQRDHSDYVNDMHNYFKYRIEPWNKHMTIFCRINSSKGTEWQHRLHNKKLDGGSAKQEILPPGGLDTNVITIDPYELLELNNINAWTQLQCDISDYFEQPIYFHNKTNTKFIEFWSKSN